MLQVVLLSLINVLTGYNFQGQIATPSAANVHVFTAMTFRSRSFLVIVQVYLKLTSTTMHGARSKLPGRGFRKQPRQGATQTSSATTGPSVLPIPSLSVSSTELLHGAGISVSGVEVREVHLEATKNSSTYRHRLREGMARFLQFLERRRVVCDWWLDVMLVNQLLVDLINEMHEEKVAICHARHCILAVQTAHRNLKGCLGRAWDCLKAWQLRQPSWSRVPIPILILRTMFAAALLQAQAEPTAQWYCFAVLIRLGFAGLLRPIELMKLRAEDVRLPQSDWEPRVVVLRLVEHKKRKQAPRRGLVRKAKTKKPLLYIFENASHY